MHNYGHCRVLSKQLNTRFCHFRCVPIRSDACIAPNVRAFSDRAANLSVVNASWRTSALNNVKLRSESNWLSHRLITTHMHQQEGISQKENRG